MLLVYKILFGFVHVTWRVKRCIIIIIIINSLGNISTEGQKNNNTNNVTLTLDVNGLNCSVQFSVHVL